MEKLERGEPDVYEIVWMSGHVERVSAHQVTWPSRGIAMMRGIMNMPAEQGPSKVQIHAEVDGKWTLMLSAREDDIRTMRLVTADEPVPGV